MKKSDHHLIQQVLDGTVSQQVFDRFPTAHAHRAGAGQTVWRLRAAAPLALTEEYEGLPTAGNVVPITGRAFSAKFALIAAAAVVALFGGSFLSEIHRPHRSPLRSWRA